MRSTGHASMRRDAAALVEEFAAFYLPGALERPRGAEDSEDDSVEREARHLGGVPLGQPALEKGPREEAQAPPRGHAPRPPRPLPRRGL